jgi:hypothetical protein
MFGFLFFSIFVGHFCPPRSGSGSTDLIESGSETLHRTSFSLVTHCPFWQAENVDWLPLAEQERLLDEEEEKESEDAALAKPSSNMTIMLPDMEDFERMAKTSSTPFTGEPLELCFRVLDHVESGIY